MIHSFHQLTLFSFLVRQVHILEKGVFIPVTNEQCHVMQNGF